MHFDRLARVIATAAIAATPALTVAAATATTSTAAASHAAATPGLSVIEIVGRSADDECCGWPGSTNSGCGF